MEQWLFTLRERFTMRSEKKFARYCEFSGFHHIRELVTLDSILCPDAVDLWCAEDWNHNVQEDNRTGLFRSAEYLWSRQPLERGCHQILAVRECPATGVDAPSGFQVCGFDIMDVYFGNSTLTNCGPIPEAFLPSDTNQFGLIDDLERAFAIRDTMRKTQPLDEHLGACEVWQVARRLPVPDRIEHTLGS